MTRQDKIAEWFDQTYKLRGKSYLRPKKAYYVFLTMLSAKKNKKILDVACGLGRLIEVAKEKELVPFGIDISKVAIEQCKQKFPLISTVVGNAENLPYTDGEFDYVTCLGSLERMLNRAEVLTQIGRVLKKDGKFCVMVRNSESFKWKFIKKPFGLVNEKGSQDALTYSQWEDLLSKNGFEIKQTYCDQWPIMKFKWLFSLGFWRKFEKIQKSIIPIKYANEFVFICVKS